MKNDYKYQVLHWMLKESITAGVLMAESIEPVNWIRSRTVFGKVEKMPRQDSSSGKVFSFESVQFARNCVLQKVSVIIIIKQGPLLALNLTEYIRPVQICLQYFCKIVKANFQSFSFQTENVFDKHGNIA